LKGALEQLPKAHETVHFSKLKALLSSEELAMAREMEGKWTRLQRGAKGLVIQEYCDGHTPTVDLEVLDDRVKIELFIGQDSAMFDVGGVQLAKDGSMTLMKLNGETLKYAISRGDKRVSRWTSSEYDTISGLFVHSDEKDAFPVDSPENCDEFFR
jgi:hypothetical protein